MKRHIIPCILSLTLLLTACGGEQAAADTAEEAVKDHYYQILDAAGIDKACKLAKIRYNRDCSLNY